MLFKNKTCKYCNHSFDETLEYCPKCSKRDEDYTNLGIPKGLIMTPILNQILFILIGFVGLIISQTIISISLRGLFETNEPLAVALANFVSYGIVFIALLLSLVNVRKTLFIKLKALKPYAFGLLFGILLIGFSYFYSEVILRLSNTGVNENQLAAESLIVGFPIASIIILGFVAPICEELTYRLGLFSYASRINKYVAYAVTTIFFGLIHFDFFSTDIITELICLPQYLIAGFLLCFTYEKFGLSASISAHCLNNLFSIIYILIASTYA